jgi:hypothetical protein
MRAAWYEKQGPSRDVLMVGEMPDPVPGAGEVRIRIAASGVNPSDTKKREDAFGYGMAYSRVIPHSDGAGTVDHIVEVAFGANIEADIELLKADFSVATQNAAELCLAVENFGVVTRKDLLAAVQCCAKQLFTFLKFLAFGEKIA